MLQKTFELQAAAPKSRILQIELGHQHVTINTFNKDFNPVFQLEHFNFKPQGGKDGLDWQSLLKDLKSQSAILSADSPSEKVLITWENDLVQPVPTALFKPETKEGYFQYYKESITAEPTDYKHLIDPTAEYQFVYSVPLSAFDCLNQDYPGATHQHKQAAITRKLSSFTDHYPLKALLVFYQDHFILTTFAQERLQLIISRPFNHGADIVYHLLSAIKEAGVSPDQCCVYLSGLIDGDSQLFKEIYKFVPVIDVDRMDNMAYLTDHPDYPSHFFVPFYKYVQ